jgi:glycosyltransferase involved in cell wall biosynthesis
MRILYVADGRSPIALNWIKFFVERGDEVHLASTFACAPALALASFTVVPVAFSGLKASTVLNRSSRSVRGSLAGVVNVRLRTTMRQWFGPLTLQNAARRLSLLEARLKPDLVHAMRIPYEGMLAALARRQGQRTPLLISVWGNDFTLHAVSTPLMARATHLALKYADGLHADCRRDLQLAARWGFRSEKPTVVLPGNGGVQLDVFYPPPETGTGVSSRSVEVGLRVINPRGWRAYVRNDAFFRAIPLVLQHYPSARFICPTMADQLQARRWLEELQLGQSVELLPLISRSEMAELFRQAQVAVSPSTHDGTPNTLLEAMACGCFPVAGDIASLREWITPGLNGLLVDPGDPRALADAIVVALSQPGLRQSAREYNTRLVSERAEYRRVMHTAVEFYQSMLV